MYSILWIEANLWTHKSKKIYGFVIDLYTKESVKSALFVTYIEEKISKMSSEGKIFSKHQPLIDPSL